MPYITQVAVGKLKELSVFGNHYPTEDGTGVRDYIHVVDLAKGHLKALEKISANSGIEAYNLGTGKGYSVLEMVSAFEKSFRQKGSISNSLSQDQVIYRFVMLTQQKQNRSLGGWQKKESMKCVKMHGDGNQIIQMGTKN